MEQASIDRLDGLLKLTCLFLLAIGNVNCDNSSEGGHSDC
jgi:hypothetical protein